MTSFHVTRLYDSLLEKNIFKLIKPYTRLQVGFIASKLFLAPDVVERKISEMILDKKVSGTLDQSKGCLILYPEQRKDRLYSASSTAIDQLITVVGALNDAALAVKKAK